MKRQEVEKMKEIILAIDQWLTGFASLDASVGTIIQRHAMDELAFLELLDGDLIPMDKLRIMANDELERLGEPRIIKPIPRLDLLPGKEALKKTMPPWVSLSYPDFIIARKPSRRSELEGMEDVEIRELYYERKKVETKRERINYIIESEKGDK